MFQFFHLLPELTGEDNVLLAGPRARRRTRRPPARGRALVDRLGLRDVAGSLPHQLSGGEQQRFAIARALVNDPALRARRRADRQPRRRGRRATCWSCCAGSPATAARSCSSPTRPAAAGIADRVLRLEGGTAASVTRRRRTLLAAAGVFAASLVVGTGATVGYGLATGFERAAARADLPDVIARFDTDARGRVDARVRALPEPRGALLPAARSSRCRWPGGPRHDRGVAHVVLGGRRGYAIIAGPRRARAAARS